MRYARFVTLDGQDSVGKTTQIGLLERMYGLLGMPVHSTRLLGGDGTDDFQLTIRRLLLHKKFPRDSAEVEEALFAMSDLEGIRAACEFLTKTPKGVVVKDRGLPSHICYAIGKGMGIGDISRVHRGVILAERELTDTYGAVSVVLVADRPEWLIDRVLARSKSDGVEVVERLENLGMQRRVGDALRALPGMEIVRGLSIRVVEVAEGDSIQDIQSKIGDAIAGHNSGL